MIKEKSREDDYRFAVFARQTCRLAGFSHAAFVGYDIDVWRIECLYI